MVKKSGSDLLGQGPYPNSQDKQVDKAFCSLQLIELGKEKRPAPSTQVSLPPPLPPPAKEKTSAKI